MTTPSKVNAFAPMVELIENELKAEGIPSPPGATAATTEEFYQWYLEAIQLLESHVADADAHPPMERPAVEILCRAALTTATLGEAIQLIEYFSTMHPGAGRLRLEQGDATFKFTLDARRRKRSMMASLVDIAGLFAFKQLFQWLTGGRATSTLVGIGWISRSDLLPFIKLFNAPVLAEGDITFLEYDSAALDAPVLANIAQFNDFFAYFPCAVFEQSNTDLARQTAALINAAVLQARPVPDQSQIAENLGYPLSTYRRRLSRQGTSFRAIRESCLGEASRDLLLRHTSIAQIALQLGFQDSDSFRRAFQRWTGMTPSAWKALADNGNKR